MTTAAQIQKGQWLVTESGAYRVDGVTVARGIAYIGTARGVCVLPADREVLVSA